MFERFTAQARAVIIAAKHEAEQLRHPYIGTEHLLLGLLAPEAGTASTVLKDAGVDAARVRADVERVVGSAPHLLSNDDAEALRTIGIDIDAVLTQIEESFGRAALASVCTRPHRHRWWWWRRSQGGAPGWPFTRRAKKVLELSLREALRLHHDYIGPEHILLGLLREGEGLASKILTDRGVTLDQLRRATLAALDEAA